MTLKQSHRCYNQPAQARTVKENKWFFILLWWPAKFIKTVLFSPTDELEILKAMPCLLRGCCPGVKAINTLGALN